MHNFGSGAMLGNSLFLIRFYRQVTAFKSQVQSNLDYPDLDYPDFSIIRTFSLVPFFFHEY